MSDTDNSTERKERKTSLLAQLAFWLALVTVVLFGIAWLISMVPAPDADSWLSTVTEVFGCLMHVWLFLVFPIGCLMSVISLVIVSVNRRKVNGVWQSLSSLGICLAIGVILFLAFRGVLYSKYCGENLKGIVYRMDLCARENDYRFPTAENWCDVLTEYMGSPYIFVCRGSDAEVGESSYAMNINVAGKDCRGVPGGVVLVFETDFGKVEGGRDGQLSDRPFYTILEWDKDKVSKERSGSQKVYSLRWNQSGGPEIATTKNHGGDGTVVAFCNGRVEFVKADRIGKLRWTVEEPNE